MKHIYDSLNGIIEVPRAVTEAIIDTPEFQRLRRIEQTSVRSIFPSARHDRFVHSLGVYHVGHLIANTVKQDLENANLKSEKVERLIKTYEMACLLHDIAHAPFSHTFEDAYGSNAVLKNVLYEVLTKKWISVESLKTDDVDERKIAPHELASAILAVSHFGEFLLGYGVDLELMCRMIMGWKYREDQESNNTLENCFIDLLNGGIIDADRLDYVRRDVKTSGYTTSGIDLHRLIKGIHILHFDDGKWHVCYNANTFNEVEAALEVRYFQGRHIFPHHKIRYEQWLLRMAVAEAIRESDLKNRDLTPSTNESHEYRLLNSMINIDAVENKLLSDDDVICKMKNTIGGNYYAYQWLSRKYAHAPLWKSIEEYNHLFGELESPTWKQWAAKKLGEQLKNQFGEDKVIVLDQKIKERVNLNDVKLILKNKDVVDLKDVREITKSLPMNFVYIYVDKKLYPEVSPTIKPQYIESLIKPILEEIKELTKAEKEG